MKIETKNKLTECNNLNDFLNLLQNDFYCKECKPGLLVKSTLIYSIKDLCKKNNVDLKNFDSIKSECINSINIFDFIEAFKTGINQNFDFSPETKKELYNYTKKIQLLTNLNPK